MQGTNRPPVDLIRNTTPHRRDTRFHQQRRCCDNAVVVVTPSPATALAKETLRSIVNANAVIAPTESHRHVPVRRSDRSDVPEAREPDRSPVREIEPIGTQPPAGEATSSSRRQGRRVQGPGSRHPVTALPAESEVSGSATLASISVTLFPNSETKMRNCCRVPGNWMRCLENLAACVGSAEQVEVVGRLFAGDAVANSEQFQAAVGDLVSVGAFVWWFYWEQKRAWFGGSRKMNWLAALAALARIVPSILEMARERQAKGTGRAEAIAEADLIRKARDAPQKNACGGRVVPPLAWERGHSALPVLKNAAYGQGWRRPSYPR